MTPPPGAGARDPATARQTMMMRLARALGHQRWIHYGTRFRLARLLLGSEIKAHREFEVRFFGQRYRGNIASFIDWSVFVFGAYERGLLQFLGDAAHALAGDDAVYVDIGANVGQHVLYMSRHAKTVHAFEPYEPVRRRIDEKIADNRIGNVSVHAVGLGEAEAGLPFYAPTSFNQGQGTFLPGIIGAEGTPVGELPVACADAWFPAHGIDRVDLIKIDVEGFEPNVLRGMRKVIERQRPVIVMEYLAETAAALGGLAGLRALLPADYAVAGLVSTPNRYRLEPFREGRPHFELVLAPEKKLATLRRLKWTGGG